MTAPNQHSSDWTDEKAEILKDRWARKWTQQQIADALGMTRSAIAGRLNRMGLMGRRGKPRAKAQPSDAPKPVRVTPFRTPKLVACVELGPPTGQRASVVVVDDVISAQEDAIACTRVALVDLLNHNCRWPIGEVGAPSFAFCGEHGADFRNGKPYCAHHQRRAKQC